MVSIGSRKAWLRAGGQGLLNHFVTVVQHPRFQPYQTVSIGSLEDAPLRPAARQRHLAEQAVLVDDAEWVVLVDLHGGADEAVLDGR